MSRKQQQRLRKMDEEYINTGLGKIAEIIATKNLPANFVSQIGINHGDIEEILKRAPNVAETTKMRMVISLKISRGEINARNIFGIAVALHDTDKSFYYSLINHFTYNKLGGHQNDFGDSVLDDILEQKYPIINDLCGCFHGDTLIQLFDIYCVYHDAGRARVVWGNFTPEMKRETANLATFNTLKYTTETHNVVLQICCMELCLMLDENMKKYYIP